MKVINIYGGPGSGKSTTAAGIFHQMKLHRRNVELVTEYAKDLVYGGQIECLLDQQEYIFAEQNYRLHRLREHVDYAITDSPITLGTVYVMNTYPIADKFEDFVFATYGLYDNINILLERGDIEFDPSGRRQDLAGAVEIDVAIKEKLQHRGIPYNTVRVGPYTVGDVLEIVEHFT